MPLAYTKLYEVVRNSTTMRHENGFSIIKTKAI